MFKNSIIPLLLLFAGMLCFDRCICKKEDQPIIACDSSNSVYIPDLIRSRFLFKTGSWWVYKNLANGDRDTFRLVDNYFEHSNLVKDFGSSYRTQKCYEYFRVNYISNNFKFINYTCGFHYPKDNLDPQKLTSMLGEKFSINQYNGGGLSITIIGKDSLLSSGLPLPYFTFNLIDSMTSGGKSYHNILHINRNAANFPNPFLEDFYASNIGLIRFVRYDNTEWELESYFIQP